MGRSSTENILQSWAPHRLKWDFTPRLTRSGTVGQLVIVAAPSCFAISKRWTCAFPDILANVSLEFLEALLHLYSFVVLYLLDIYWTEQGWTCFFLKDLDQSVPATNPKATRDVSHRLDRQVRDLWFRNLGKVRSCHVYIHVWQDGTMDTMVVSQVLIHDDI